MSHHGRMLINGFPPSREWHINLNNEQINLEKNKEGKEITVFYGSDLFVRSFMGGRSMDNLLLPNSIKECIEFLKSDFSLFFNLKDRASSGFSIVNNAISLDIAAIHIQHVMNLIDQFIQGNIDGSFF